MFSDDDVAKEEVIIKLDQEAIYSTIQFFHEPVTEFIRIGEPGDPEPNYTDIFVLLDFYKYRLDTEGK